jgi:methionine sulfoxide reductase heme-binding subunit
MQALITQWLKHPATKVVVFLLLLLPALWLLIQIVLLPQQLGVDPAKAVVDQTGEWAIQSLWLALTITPLRILTGISQWIRYRRMVGLFAFFYSLLHILAYSVLLIGLDLGQLINDLTQRPYIIVGAIAFVAYLPLVITSTQHWQRKLKRHWVQLHRVVYLIAILALLHLTWLKKVGLYDSWPYLLILVLLFGLRIWEKLRKNA